MAYDAAKAHEYYENYVKKGKKKGRKKGKSKKKSSSKATRLVGLSTAGLNDAGKMEVALVKEKIQAEMNEALKKASTPSEKEKVRKEYQSRALQEISKIKSNASFASAKKSSAKSSGKSSGGSSSKGSGSKSSSGSSKSSSKSSSQTKKLDDIKNEISNLTKTAKNLPEEKKEQLRTAVNQIIKQLQTMKGLNASSLIRGLRSL